MCRALLTAMLACLTSPSLAQQVPSEQRPTLAQGIQLVNEGDLENGLLTLDAVVRDLAVDPVQHKKDLSQGYLYRGIAFVGLAQEESAKGSFAAALLYDETLRLTEDKFPPRVIRVFEAARQGKTKSVLLPPSGAVKKAGLGVAGAALIVGGLLAAGGAAVALSDSSPPAPGVTLISASPAAGSTVSVRDNEPVTLHLRVVSSTEFAPSLLCVDYLASGESSAGPCGRSGCPGNCIGQSAPIPAGIPQEFVISIGAGTSSRTCVYPRVTDRAFVCFMGDRGQELRLPELPITYTFVDR